MHRFTTHIRVAIMLALVTALGAMWAPGAAAQDDTFELPIQKLDCETDPGFIDPLELETGNLPAGCTFGVGQTFYVAPEGGPGPVDPQVVLGSCTIPAGPPPVCYVTVPVPSTVIVTEDVSTAAAGFAPRENPITVSVEPATEASAVFVNLPVELPETGTGSATASMDDSATAGLLGALSLLFVGAGILRRRTAA